MSFGDRKLDLAYDRWVTQTPEEAGFYEEVCIECELPLDECECVEVKEE